MTSQLYMCKETLLLFSYPTVCALNVTIKTERYGLKKAILASAIFI